MEVIRTTITVLFIMFHTLIKEQQALNLQDYSNYINEKKNEINKKQERVRKLNEEVVEDIEASCQAMTCNFDESMCDFEQDKSGKFIWTRRKGRGPSAYTGPFDHTTGSATGSYMYIDTSSLGQCDENVKLSSSPLKFLRNMCLKFYYRLHGVNAGSLIVTVAGKLLFSASDLYVENIWLEAGINTSSITGSLMGTHRVTFEASPGKGRWGGIAIDDFSFTAGSCPLSLPCDSNAPIGISDPSIISDGHMNASSQHDSPRYKPYYGRLHDKRGDGWCPSPTAEGNDWLQIDLRDTFVVCAVATQGNRDGKAWTAFKLSYSSDGKKWKFFKYGDCTKKEFQRKGRSDDVDKYVLPVQIHARFIRFHPTNRHNRSCLRVEVFGTRVFSSNNFQKYQDLPTSGAVDVEQFTINGSQFLAFANSRTDTDGFNTKSFIYKMNFTEKFSLYQTINTMGVTDMEYFTIADTHYLAVANFEFGFTPRLKLVIYRWNGQFFVVFQNITTYGNGTADLNFFKIGTEPFLTIVNLNYEYNDYWIELEIYKWINNSFDMYEATGIRAYALYGASTEFVIKNETFIVMAAGNHLYVFKRLRGAFRLLSPVRPIQLTYGARDVKSFKMNGQIFLAIANFEDGTKPNILRWQGNCFVLYQSLFTTEAIAIHPFVMYSQNFLGVVDAHGKSIVYRAIGSRFFKFRELSTQGAHRMTSFVHGGHTYLVVANTKSEEKFNINSTVYKFK